MINITATGIIDYVKSNQKTVEVIIILVCAALLGLLIAFIIRGLRKHKHHFKPYGTMKLVKEGKEYLRLVLLCGCQAAVHVPIYSWKEFKEREKFQ